MNNKIRVYIAILLYISVEKVSGSVSRIIGGEDAPAEFGQFHASIQNLTGHHVCGGTVVSNSFVVTAAHCVNGVNPAYTRIVSGTNHLGTGGKQYDVVDIIVYDKYNPNTRENDIALLKANEPFNLRYIHNIKLRKEALVAGEKVFLAGFGAREPNGISSCKMQTLNSTVFDQDICKYAMRYADRPVTNDMFCTFTTFGEGTCHGDSGSPLVDAARELVGIVSWGFPCAIGFPDVHTRMSPYFDWVQNYIETDNFEPPPLTLLEKLKYMAEYTKEVPAGLKVLLEMETQ